MADPTSPRFEQVTVLAPGLLGASVLMAVQERGLARRTAVWARREQTRQQCAQQPWCDAVFATPEEAVAQADIVVLCPPVEHIVPLLRQIAPHLKAGATVTDVGSTKASICTQAAGVALPSGCAFIGSHPMAGSEKTGLENGRADLFDGRTCLVIEPTAAQPTANTSANTTDAGKATGTAATTDAGIAAAVTATTSADGAAASEADAAALTTEGMRHNKAAADTVHTHVERICTFWRGLGMRVFTPTASEHDRLVAEVSHLPHVLASVLSAWLARDAHVKERHSVAGPGLRDTTRIAAGDPDLWLSIIRDNRSEIIRALEGFNEASQAMLRALQTNDDDAVRQALADGKAARDMLGANDANS